ncbi:unnamed protein product [Somion occarium]|uniref:DUF6535 domain-containing protein n=1 Tax=Somion occarium TaxID=3059160 RepID=A0ABP1ECD7_9APHY
MLVQYWTRRYKHLVSGEPGGSAQHRASIRTYLREGLDLSCLEFFARFVLSAFMHISVFLFLAGLLLFFRNINMAVAHAVEAWVTICGIFVSLDMLQLAPIVPWQTVDPIANKSGMGILERTNMQAY